MNNTNTPPNNQSNNHKSWTRSLVLVVLLLWLFGLFALSWFYPENSYMKDIWFISILIILKPLRELLDNLTG